MSLWAGPQQVRGVGIGLRFELWQALRETTRRLDWLEIIAENYVEQGGWRRQQRDEASARWPLIAHGVSASVGGPHELQSGELKRLKRLLDELGAEYYSDHLCWTRSGKHHYHDLLPLPRTEEAVRWCAGRARRISEALERPLLLENVTYYATMPGSVLTEGEFVSAVLEEADAYLLLDLNNSYLNAVNHGLEPLAELCALPLARARQMHLAGHEHDEEGVLLDRHGGPVADPVWELYREAVRRVGPLPTLIEWDNDIPPLERVLDEADRARAVMGEELSRVA
jgi:uncharacterized protein (UPF0276 family)